MSASYSVHNANYSGPAHGDAVVDLLPYRDPEDHVEARMKPVRFPRLKLTALVLLTLVCSAAGVYFVANKIRPTELRMVSNETVTVAPKLSLQPNPLYPFGPVFTPTTEETVDLDSATTTPSRTKREHNEVDEPEEQVTEQSFTLSQVEEIAQAVLEHDVSLQQAHLDGFRAAGLNEATLARLQRQLTRTELKRRRRRSTISDYATSAGIEALKFAFKSFDLVPKAYKKTSPNPGYEVGVPSGHARTLRGDGYYGSAYDYPSTLGGGAYGSGFGGRSPYGYPSGANRGLAVGELSGGGRRYNSGYGGLGGSVPITNTF